MIFLAFAFSMAWATTWPDGCANRLAASGSFTEQQLRSGLLEIERLEAQLLTHFDPAKHTFVLVGRSNTILSGRLAREPGVQLRHLPVSFGQFERRDYSVAFLREVMNTYLDHDRRPVFIDFAKTGETFAALDFVVSETIARAYAGFAVMSAGWPRALAPQPGARWLHLPISENLRELFLGNAFKAHAPYPSFNLRDLRQKKDKTGVLPTPVFNERFHELEF